MTPKPTGADGGAWPVRGGVYVDGVRICAEIEEQFETRCQRRLDAVELGDEGLSSPFDFDDGRMFSSIAE
jgi:hypothetical protein